MAQAQAHAMNTAFTQALEDATATDRELAEYYRGVGHAPLWTGESAQDPARRAALLRALGDADMHGLPVARYDLPGLLARLGDIRSAQALAEAEVALSRAYLAYARDLQSGVVVPSRVDFDIKRDVVRRSAPDLLEKMRVGEPRAVIRALAPQSNEYRRLQKHKLILERRVAAGGWGAVVPADSLRPGATGPAVLALRDRLVAMGYLSRSATASYDGTIQAAVQAFQGNHGLETDGVAGPATMAAINTGPEQRLKSVIVAMERERWLPAERGTRHILVNLADFSARIIDDDRVTFETRAVIGKNAGDRRSPEFSDQMKYMVINPTWHVPRSIVARDYLPKLQGNRNAASYLKLYDSSGREVPRGAVNFNAYTGRNFPFAVKQPPSDNNALGLVKFMFPNKWNIYLHDTPQKHLFQPEKRDFSSGCIRLQQPFEFAYELLSRQEADPQSFFHSVLDTGRETYVNLKKHVPIHLIYRTAVTQAGGAVQYRDDIYGRDARIWEALERAGVRLGGLNG
ncbi:MAG: L,D-transpeptidase family protein [Roseovarius sp.]|nr:L,D-transpeptidase family protein [Roseovarius sp.]